MNNLSAVHLGPRQASFQHELSRLKRKPGVYVLSAEGAPLHLSWSTNLERRIERVLLRASPSTGQPGRLLGDVIDAIDCWPTGSRLELQIVLYWQARRIYPERYQKFLKLRAPWFLGMVENSAFARLETANRLPRRWREGEAVGPFSSRAAADQYQAETLGLFQLRRCSEILEPSAGHPGCMYGEMNQCLRPCQLAVSEAEYASEAQRVREFLETNGRSALAGLTAARERAVQELDFEQAAQAHKRIEKVKAAAALRDPVVAGVRQFNGVALTRALEPGQFMLWPLWAGLWQDPVRIDFLGREPGGNDPGGQSLDATLRQLLSRGLDVRRTEGEITEELAIFSRWYYSSWRDGEWFPFRQLSELNYRKLVRDLSKMAKA